MTTDPWRLSKCRVSSMLAVEQDRERKIVESCLQVMFGRGGLFVKVLLAVLSNQVAAWLAV